MHLAPRFLRPAHRKQKHLHSTAVINLMDIRSKKKNNLYKFSELEQ